MPVDARRGGLWGIVCSAILTAVVLWRVDSVPHPAVDPPMQVVGAAVLALLWWLASTWPLTVEFRGQKPAFTLNGVPLALGLVFLGPVPTLVARLLGTAAALVQNHRQSGLKLGVNLSSCAPEVWVAWFVFGSLLADGGFTNDPTGWVAVGSAVFVADLVTGLIVLLAIRISVGPLQDGALHNFLIGNGINSAVNIPLSVLSVLVLVIDLRTVVLLVPFALLLASTNRQRHVLGERFAETTRLYGFISDLSTSTSTEALVHRILQQSMEVSGATRVRLLIVGQRLATLWRSDGTMLIGEDVSPLAAAALLHRADGGVLFSYDDIIDLSLRPLLPDRFEQALVGKFSNAELRGAVLLADREDHLELFDEDDQRLVQALAEHAGTALGSSHLLGRMKTEALRREQMALRDPSTGMDNRYGLLDICPTLSDGVVFVVGIRDLTAFGTSFGHEVSEAIAVKVGNSLRVVADADGAMVARLSSAQFAVIVDRQSDLAEAESRARRLVEAASEPVRHGGLSINVEVRVGVSLAPQHGTETRELLRAADMALTDAEEARRSISWFEFSRDRETTRRLELASELRAAINGNQLGLAYQPKIDLTSGKVVGVEALCRWPHAQRGYISPVEFIDIAERTGLIRPLTLWVTRTAVAQAVRWREEGLEISVAINLSNALLTEAEVPWEIVRMVEDCGLPSSAVILEITESHMSAEISGNGGAMAVFNTAGIALSVDDFGTGYSSLAQLKSLNVQELKIDRAFVTCLKDDPTDRAVCAAIITMARELKLRVVGEGIEDAATAAIMADLGCDVGQGFYYQRPVPADQIPGAIAEIEAMTVDGIVSRLADRTKWNGGH